MGIVFQAIIISRIQCAISAWGGFVHSDWKPKIDTLLLRAHRSGPCSDLTFDASPFSADQTLFKAMCSNEHCLHHIVPAMKSSQYDMRNRGHDRARNRNKNISYCAHCKKEHGRITKVIK
jgi:hypothetical protein